MSRVRGRQSVGELLLDWSIDQPLPDRRLPVALLSKSQKAAELQRVQARRAMDAAYEAELVMGLADDTPDTLDPPAGHPGAKKGSWAPDTELPGVSEFFTAELAVVLNCGRGTASHLAQRAWLYRESLPATWAAMAEGELDEPRAKVLADVLAHTAPAIARAVEAQVLREATGLSLGRLKARALALLIKLDADAVNARRKDAQRHADVRSYPSQLEGMSTLAADLPTPVSAECLDVVDQLAAMLKADGDPRPIGELRAAVLADLIRRPWDTRLPAVTARLHITAPLPSLAGHSAEPGEVGGQPITAVPPPRAGGPAGLPRSADAGVRLADLRDHRRRGAPAGHRVPRDPAAPGPPRVPRAPRSRLPVPGAGRTRRDHRVSAHRRAGRVGPHA